MLRHLALTDSGPPLTPEEIAAFEREIGGQLPDDYRGFMLAHNGGIPERTLGIIWNGEMETLLGFESLMPRTSASGIRGSLRFLHELNPVSTDGYLPIGGPGENFICLAIRGNVGAVLHTGYTYKTVYMNDRVPIDVTMLPLADSFSEFLERLIEIPDPYCRIEELGEKGLPEDLAKFLGDGNSINDVGKNILTVICEAVGFNNVPIVCACIEHGASLSGTIKAAVQARRTHLIQLLIEAGADINERDQYGLTPLHFVGGWGLPGDEGARNRELRDLLIRLGAVE